MRKSDILARMGGDEFAVILHNIFSEQDAAQIADSIKRSLREPFYLIRNITTDPDDVSIVKAIITMGHSLNLKILAEGVETREQKELLSQLQCDEIQGYLISKPVPLPKLIRFWN